MTHAAPEAKLERLHALDGLRGAAAVAVFFYHALSYLPISESTRAWIDVSPLGPLCNGPGAVHVFFVLSGYVLAMTLAGDAGAGRLPRYYARRIFRIHPPYVAGVLLAWWASRAVAVAAGADGLAWGRMPAAGLPMALAFPSMAFGLLPVGWSLFVEMAMSAVFPLLFVAARRLHPLVPLAAGVLLLHDLDPRLSFLRFTIDFALGLVLRLEAVRLARAVRALPPIAPALAMLAGLALLQAPLAGTTIGHGGLERGHSGSAVAHFAVAAALMLVAALHSPTLGRWLASPLGRYCGRVSYSFYLVHHTVLLALFGLAGGAPRSWGVALGLVALAFAASFALAELGWRAVEAPSIRAGRALIRGGTALFARARAA